MKVQTFARLMVATAALALLGAPARADWPFDFGSTMTPAATEVTPVRVYKLGGVAREKTSPWDLLGGESAVVMPELLQQIAADTHTPEVHTLLLKIGDLQLGPAQAQELAAALAAAREAKKRVLVHLARGDLLTLVASAPAERIAITPESAVFVPGLQAEVSFYKDLLSTIGVEADFEAVGQYKSAMEPFTRSTLSDAARENLEAVVDGLYRTLVEAIARPRRRDVKAVEAAIDRGLLTAEDARRAGLVDDLRYWSEVLAAAEETAKGKAGLAWPKRDDAPELGSIFDLIKLFSGDSSEPEDSEPRVAVLVAEGPIVEGRDPSDLMNADNVIAAEDLLDELHRIEADTRVKALVVRIDSPGGSALASDVIWRELDRVDKKIPVVASLGNVAASGGYYVAAAARKIYADPTTLTGSIGVFGGKLVYRGLLDKIGVGTTVIARGKNAGMFSGLARFSESERAAVKASMEHTYKTFVNRVAKGRNMSFDAVHKVAQGRVWTGRQAHEVGLVDKLGGLDDAVHEAARLSRAWSGDARPRVQIFPKHKTLFDLLGQGREGTERLRFGGQLRSLARTLPRPVAGAASRLAHVLESLVDGRAVLAMMPMAIELR